MRLFEQGTFGKAITHSPGKTSDGRTRFVGDMPHHGNANGERVEWGVRDTNFTLADGTWLAVRYYPSAAPAHLVLLDAPNHSEAERDDLARYLAESAVAQVYRLRESIPQARVRKTLGSALIDVLQTRNPEAPVLLGAFSTDEGMTFSFPDGFLGMRGDVPPGSFVAMRDGTPLALREYAAEADTAVIVLHGATTQDKTYAALARYLASRNLARVFVPNLRRHGLSPYRRDTMRSLTQAQEDVADVIAHVRTMHPHARVIVLGHSFGAGVAVHASRRGTPAKWSISSRRVFPSLFLRIDDSSRTTASS